MPQRWEYLVAFDPEWKRAGEEGWELVAAFGFTTGHREFYFKRPLPERPVDAPPSPAEVSRGYMKSAGAKRR